MKNKIIILGWYGSGNTGDEAVLEATVGALQARGFHDLHVLSTDPQGTAGALGVGSSRRTLGPDTLRAMWGARALVLGGGGLIQDGTSVYNLPLYALFVAVARLLGLKVVGWGLGVEPIWTHLGKLLARYIIRASDHFSVRDGESLRLLTVAGVPTRQVRVTADPAFLLPVERQTGGMKEDSPNVIFCLRDLSDNHPGINAHYLLPVSIRKRLGTGWKPAPERSEGLVRAAVEGVEYCVKRLGARVTLLALWPGRDDAILGRVREGALDRGLYPGALTVENSPLRPTQVAQLAASADLLVSMRLHALIFAANAGVPMLALQYAHKMGGQMHALGMGEWVIEVDKRSPSPGELRAKLSALWTRKHEVNTSLVEAARRAREQAEADADAVASALREA